MVGLVIMFVGWACVIIWAVIRNQRKREKHEQEMTESRKMRTALSYDDMMERFRELGTDVDAIIERTEKDITDPEFLPRSEQDYVDALAARYQNAGYKIISKNCGSQGADIIMRYDGRKIIIEAKLYTKPQLQKLYSAIGQVLRYGVENNGTILAIACFDWGYSPMPKWFTNVCKKYNIQ